MGSQPHDRQPPFGRFRNGPPSHHVRKPSTRPGCRRGRARRSCHSCHPFRERPRAGAPPAQGRSRSRDSSGFAKCVSKHSPKPEGQSANFSAPCAGERAANSRRVSAAFPAQPLSALATKSGPPSASDAKARLPAHEDQSPGLAHSLAHSFPCLPAASRRCPSSRATPATAAGTVALRTVNAPRENPKK